MAADHPSPDVESVWDYPRPPRLEPVRLPIRVELAGAELAATRRAWRVLETSHPPTYYIPPEDVATHHLQESGRQTFCEWKGRATYFDVRVGQTVRPNAAWCYRHPSPGCEPIAGYITFYASLMDACWVGDERVTPQAGDFYGGWITSRIVGPFKGAPGTTGW